MNKGFFPTLCLAWMQFDENVGNYGRNSWQNRNWRERDGLCLTRVDRGGWICRKQTGTPVINSRNQRYMANPSITTATFSYILLQRYAARPSITIPLFYKCSQQHLSLLQSHCTDVVAGGKLRHSYRRNGFIVATD